MSKKRLVLLMCVFLPVALSGQTSADSAAYRRAQSLVNDGNAASGRAIVDSLIAQATPGTNAYAEGLYWRAVLSSTAADAEMDYRRIIVDYPMSPRSEDVLLRLAQLELARADYDGALQHLDRLTREHPAGAARARASYWTARVLFEKNDIPRACGANADALSRTTDADTELRNQIAYLNQRCVGVATNPIVTSPRADSSVGVKTDTAVKPAVAALSTAPAVTPQSGSNPQKPSMKPPATPRDGKPTMVNPAEGLPAKEATKSTTAKSAPTEASSSEGDGYSVQVAAYNVRSQAQALVAKLKTKGYEARVSGSTAPFRVRIGHYPTQAQASAVMRSLKAKKIDGFVVKAEAR